MGKIISFMHISLDGFVAGSNGEMDWIKINDEIFDFVGKRISTGNTALYGRKTYEMMEGYWPTAAEKPNASKHDKEHSKWYSKVHKVVLSQSLKNVKLANTTIISEHLSEEINAVKQQTPNDILLFGSPTATHALIQQNLIDGYWLFVNPVILGKGIPLFKDVQEKTALQLIGSHTFDCGVIELNYLVNQKE